jgi:hypothetical protein
VGSPAFIFMMESRKRVLVLGNDHSDGEPSVATGGKRSGVGSERQRAVG